MAWDHLISSGRYHQYPKVFTYGSFLISELELLIPNCLLTLLYFLYLFSTITKIYFLFLNYSDASLLIIIILLLKQIFIVKTK